MVQQFGPPDDIYNRLVNTFVAGFMGLPPMNLIPATVVVEVGVAVARVESMALGGVHAAAAPYCRQRFAARCAHRGTVGRATRAHD